MEFAMDGLTVGMLASLRYFAIGLQWTATANTGASQYIFFIASQSSHRKYIYIVHFPQVGTFCALGEDMEKIPIM